MKIFLMFLMLFVSNSVLSLTAQEKCQKNIKSIEKLRDDGVISDRILIKKLVMSPKTLFYSSKDPNKELTLKQWLSEKRRDFNVNKDNLNPRISYLKKAGDNACVNASYKLFNDLNGFLKVAAKEGVGSGSLKSDPMSEFLQNWWSIIEK